MTYAALAALFVAATAVIAVLVSWRCRLGPAWWVTTALTILGLLLLTVVFDNAEWGAVRKATRGMYPKGHAMKANRPALISLAPSPHYHQISQACGGWGERVEDVNDLPKAIDRALSVVRTEKRQALLSVACG